MIRRPPTLVETDDMHDEGFATGTIR